MEEKRKRGGGDVKHAPPGFYTAAEAVRRLGLNRTTFYTAVKAGQITRYTPPLHKEGYYLKKEIDRLADEFALLMLSDEPGIATRAAQPGDAEGIASVLIAMGWQTATPQQRRAWYKVNPYIDYVVTVDGAVMGYVTCVPYDTEAMAAMMSGRKRAWDITPSDINPYIAGVGYDAYVGVATRQDVPHHRRLSVRLLSGFMEFLLELAAQDVTIARMYAVSAEPDGQRLCEKLGFVRQEVQPGDLFPRYALDLETSESRFAVRYREAIRDNNQNRKEG